MDSKIFICGKNIIEWKEKVQCYIWFDRVQITSVSMVWIIEQGLIC